MVKCIKELGVPFVKTVSNGMLLTDRLIGEICEADLDAIEFSLDGISFEQNDLIRRDCKGKSVVEKIKRLIYYKKMKAIKKPEIFISTTQFAQKCGKIIELSPIVPLYLTEAFSDEMKNHLLSFKTTIAMKWPEMIVDENQFLVFRDEDGSDIQNYCDHIVNTITVRWNGDIVPCCYDLTSKLVLGNIRDTNLKNIWNNEKYLSLRMNINEKQFPSLCYECNTVNHHQYLLIK